MPPTQGPLDPTPPTPPSNPTLDLGLPTGKYSTSSAFTEFAQAATVTDGTNKIQGLQIRIDSGNGTLGVVNGGSLQTVGTVGKIGYQYTAGTKLLRLTDTSADTSATAADFQAVLRTVAIASATGPVSVSANLGKPVYDSGNGHYYEFIPFSSGTVMSWTASNAAATSSTFLGFNGYLATVTDAAENSFLTASFDSSGWLGGEVLTKDASGKRVWQWAGGPEAGQSFWIGDAANGPNAGSTTGTNSPYANWDSGEPNNLGGNEPYAQFITGGHWNDLQNAPSYQANSVYSPDGYWIEYSEAPGAPSQLTNTRDTIALTPGVVSTNPQLDLVFSNPNNGQVSFGFTGNGYNIPSEALTGDTPLLTSNTTNSPYPGYTDWKLVSAQLDVDRDGKKDLLFSNQTTGAIAVIYGASRTGSSRDFAYNGAAIVTNASGTALTPQVSDGWSLEFASNTIGANNTAGILWRNLKTGVVAIWNLSGSSGAVPTAITNFVVAATNVGPSTATSDWKAIGDGEFNQNTASREVIWINDADPLYQSVATWSLTSDRTMNVSAPIYTINRPVFKVWKIVGLGNISTSNGVNDNIVWQNGSLVVVWSLQDGALTNQNSPTEGISVISLTAPDRIKALADVDGDGVLDLVGQNDSNGTIAAYTLTSAYGLKNTAAPRTQYTSDNPAGYRPAKGGLNNSVLELVNVAQYGA